MAQMLARVEVLRTLPPQAFWPAPKIDSALVRVRRDDRLGRRGGVRGVCASVVFRPAKDAAEALSQAGYPADEMIARQSLDPQARTRDTLTGGDLRAMYIGSTAPGRILRSCSESSL